MFLYFPSFPGFPASLRASEVTRNGVVEQAWLEEEDRLSKIVTLKERS